MRFFSCLAFSGVVRLGFFLVLSTRLLACTQQAAESAREPAASVDEIAPGILKGYLAPGDLPNSATLLSAPPQKESAAFAADEAASQAGLAQRDTPRWEQAQKDAELYFPKATQAFSGVLGFEVSESATPHLYMLLRRTLADAGFSTEAAKKMHQRSRPFMVNDQPMCTPKLEELLRQDGSYPSGHSALGWGWALVLTEVLPEKTDAILERGYQFGQSRVICNVHWQSDVDAGRIMGAAAVARLHANPEFLAELEEAKSEAAAALARSQ